MLMSLRNPFAAFVVALVLSCPALAQLEPVEPAPVQEAAPPEPVDEIGRAHV